MATPSTPSTKLVLEPNTPQQIALRYPTGKIVDSHFGDGQQVFFSLVDGRQMYLPLGVGQSINNLRLRANEPFMICKRWNGSRTQKPRYDVWLTTQGEKDRATTEAAADEQSPFSGPPDEEPSEMERQLAASINNALEHRRQRDAAAAARKPPAAATAPPQAPPQGTGTNGPVAVPQRAAAPPQAPAPATRQSVPIKATYAEAMTEFLLAAGRATRQAEQVLGAEGGSVRFDSRDVAALATSMFIAADRAGCLQRGAGA